jgi:hypothetical protein
MKTVSTIQEEVIKSIKEAQQEIKDGKGLSGDLDELVKVLYP